jgi:hypothetical protein
MDLSNYMLIDVSSGTMLTAQSCVLIHEDALSEAEWDALDGAPDSDIADIGRERGKPLQDLLPCPHPHDDGPVLDAIAGLLREEWDGDTLDTVRDLVSLTGRLPL